MHTQKGFVEYSFICDIRSSFVIISQYWTKFDGKKLEKHIKHFQMLPTTDLNITSKCRLLFEEWMNFRQSSKTFYVC